MEPNEPKKLLILIGGDPRVSNRPAEAIRIAAGVGAWKKVQIDLYFEGEALRCLTDAAEDLEGGALLVQYLPAIQEHGGKIYVEAGHPILREIKVEVCPVDRAQASELVRGSDYQMNFDSSLRTLQSEMGSGCDAFLDALFAD